MHRTNRRRHETDGSALRPWLEAWQMANQEPDRGMRRRWFRFHGAPTDATEPLRDEPGPPATLEPAPADPLPTDADLEPHAQPPLTLDEPTLMDDEPMPNG